MPILAALGASVGKVLIGMATSLLTESFLKPLVIHGLEALARKTQSDLDDQVVKDVKKTWGIDQ